MDSYRTEMHKHKYYIWIIVLVCFWISAFLFSTIAATANDVTLLVSFIDVGQGDAALIQDPSGFDILIDGGKTSAGPTVLSYLREQGIDDIDVMVASHADSDHIGGLIDVLNADDIPVEAVLYNGYPGTTSTWSTFATAVADEGVALQAAQFPQEYTWGSLTAHILNPVAGLVDPDQNNASVVILLDQGQNQFLFTGDIDTSTESEIIARGTPVAAEILKVAHHGSKYSTGAAFLLDVQPNEAVISVGDNPYGHPTDETLSRLLAAGAQIWRTDQAGTIVVMSDSITYTVLPAMVVDSKNYLPLIIRFETSAPAPTETPSPSPTTTVTAEPSETPTPTATQTTQPEELISIVNVFFDGAGSTEPDEYVEIRNDGSAAVDLNGWTLRDNAEHIFTFPNFLMQPGQVCRIYTNENQPEWCGFNYSSGSAIWNNTGDCAYLRDEEDQLADDYCY